MSISVIASSSFENPVIFIPLTRKVPSVNVAFSNAATNNSDNLETIIQQNDESAIQERVDAYIGVIALLVSLSLVI